LKHAVKDAEIVTQHRNELGSARESSIHADGNASSLSEYFKWLPTLTKNIQHDLANTLRKVVQLVSHFGLALPLSVQVHVKRFILSLPTKWVNHTNTLLCLW
jgi:hypothetical protein